MVKILLYTNITHNLDFKSVDGSYVVKKNTVYKVPATEREAIGSSLMGFLEKRRFAKFLEFIYNYDESNPKTTQGKNLRDMKARDLLKSYKFDDGTNDFIGHALALYRDESYLDDNAYVFAQRCNLYMESLSMSVHNYKGSSPYLYPLFGLGDLPQAFARLAAIHGGTFMLNQPVDQILYDEDGNVSGIRSGNEEAPCTTIVADPSYFLDKVKKVSQVIRCICILKHPVPNTNNAESCQIILPQNQIGRKSDIYISVVSYAHNIAPTGYYIAIVSTTVETDNPQKELEPGLKLLGQIEKTFYKVSDVYEPDTEWAQKGIHISKSYDPTSHFETVVDDVMRLYKQIMGKDLDMSQKMKVPVYDEQ